MKTVEPLFNSCKDAILQNSMRLASISEAVIPFFESRIFLKLFSGTKQKRTKAKFWKEAVCFAEINQQAI